jgi:VWFA-related protein
LISTMILITSILMNIDARVGQQSYTSDGLLLELPNNGDIQIENWRGSVSVEIWKEKFLSIGFETNGKLAESPIVIDRSSGKLIIKVEAGLANTSPNIDLKIKLPSSAQAVVLTKDGKIDLTGEPLFFGGQTLSGEINLTLSTPLEVDLTAEALNGTINLKDGFDQVAAEGLVKQKFEHHAANSSKRIRVSSEHGNIYLRSNASSIDRPITSSNKLPQQINEKREEVPTSNSPNESKIEAEDEDVIRVETNLVTLNFSVIDHQSGTRLATLKQTDFKLYEDNIEQQIANVESSAAPFDLVLLLDLSGSIGRGIGIVKEAALKFVESTRPQDRIAIITFASEIKVLSTLTDNRDVLRSSIQSMSIPKGDTKLYDAVKFSMDQLGTDNQSLRRRAIVVMSDGLDSTLPQVTGAGSTIQYEELKRLVEMYDGIFYSVWINQEYEAFHPSDIQPETFDLAYNRLLELAEVGGGLLYEVEKLEDLEETYAKVVEDLGTVYTLSYHASNKVRDGNWRQVSITVPTFPNVTIRGKRGYYAR